MQTIEEYKAYIEQLRGEVGKWHHAYDALMVESNAKINMLASECRALREMNVKAQEEITALKDAQRWRNVEEELPHKGQKVLFRAKYKTDNVRTWIGEFRNVDFDVFFASAPGWGCEFLPNEIFGWIPLPKAPEEK